MLAGLVASLIYNGLAENIKRMPLLNLETAVEPPNTPKYAEKTKSYFKKQSRLFGLTTICSKPLIYRRVSAFIGG